jgi:mono/diheme cytochrome c family protein
MRKLFKWIGLILGVLAGLLLIAYAIIYFRSEAVMNKRYAVQVRPVPIPGDEAAIERGRELVHTTSVCIDCHGDNLGGGIVVDDPALGRVVAPNLTTGQNGIGAQRSDNDLVAVLRYGVLPDGRSVRIMPADDYTHLSDTDLGAIIAYIRSLPPVDSTLPPTELRPLGRILLALGQLDIMIAERIDFEQAGSPEMTPEVTVEYGEYLANISGCTGCHGPGLSGGLIPGAPPDWPQAANLTPSGAVGQWSEMDFLQTIRTGVNPDGKQLVDEMPWKNYRNMSDDELKALWAFVHSVPAKPAGSR